MDLKSKIILIYGPTASGKSEFAIQLANKINGEIINADSMQVYKELKILTARPYKKKFKKIRHHLYGFQSVRKNFSTGDWLKLVKKKISELKKKKKVPILVGGTGLYFKALTEGLVKFPNIPNRFRQKIRILQKKLGSKKFYLRLVKEDPLVINKFGIPEPISDKILYPSILIVPLVAFDKNLNRIGYGGGFYDRYIKKQKKSKKIITIGLAYPFQRVKKIPIDKYDIRLDFILTN